MNYNNYNEWKNRKPNTIKQAVEDGKLVPIEDSPMGSIIVVGSHIYDILKKRVKELEDVIIDLNIKLINREGE